MNCPLCLDTTLDVTFHAGVELDICPRCRGVWLDRGELERIARGPDLMAPPPGAPAAGLAAPPAGAPVTTSADRGSVERPTTSKKKKSKKKQFADRLGDVFEEILDL